MAATTSAGVEAAADTDAAAAAVDAADADDTAEPSPARALRLVRRAQADARAQLAARGVADARAVAAFLLDGRHLCSAFELYMDLLASSADAAPGRPDAASALARKFQGETRTQRGNKFYDRQNEVPPPWVALSKGLRLPLLRKSGRLRQKPARTCRRKCGC